MYLELCAKFVGCTRRLHQQVSSIVFTLRLISSSFDLAGFSAVIVAISASIRPNNYGTDEA